MVPEGSKHGLPGFLGPYHQVRISCCYILSEHHSYSTVRVIPANTECKMQRQAAACERAQLSASSGASEHSKVGGFKLGGNLVPQELWYEEEGYRLFNRAPRGTQNSELVYFYVLLQDISQMVKIDPTISKYSLID